MGTFADEWKGILEDFQDSITKDLEEIRQHKAEVQAMKQEMQAGQPQGLFYRDGERLIISAPEVIIGNVDECGMLLPGSSRVTLRAGEVNLQGVGGAGVVHTKAASIRQTAVDPGIDGREEVVRGMSEVVSHATNIVLHSEDATDVFAQRPDTTSRGGITIHSDSLLQLDASVRAERRKKDIEERIKGLEKTKGELEKAASNQKDAFVALAEKVESIFKEQEDLAADDNEVRTNYSDIEYLQVDYDLYSHALSKATESWMNTISTLAEICRQISALKEAKETIVTGDEYKKKSTGASVMVKGERIDLVSVDGENNLRDNEGSGVGICANEVTIASREGDHSLKEKGQISLAAKTLNLETVNPNGLQYDKDGTVKKGKYPVEGDVFIRSKNVTIEAVDNEVEDSKPKETALTKEGRIAMRAEKMEFDTTDTEGKAAGSVSMNSKAVSIRSMDVDKEKRTDNKLAAGSTMLLLSEKMYVGAKDKDNKSKRVQAVSEELGLFADKTLEAQQGEAKAVLQLADGKTAISGSKNQIYGDTVINSKTEVKDEVKAPKATIDNIEAKSSFKSSNISDGIAVPAAPASASLSAKLKTEELKDEKK